MKYELRFTEKKGDNSLANSANHIGRNRIEFDSYDEMRKFIIDRIRSKYLLLSINIIICESGWIDVEGKSIDGKDVSLAFAYYYQEMQ